MNDKILDYTRKDGANAKYLKGQAQRLFPYLTEYIYRYYGENIQFELESKKIEAQFKRGNVQLYLVSGD